MTTKDDFIQAVEGVDARLEALRERIIATNGETPLKEGTWRVRDALSHLAARSNGVSRVLARLDPPPPGAGQSQAPRAPRSVDEINAGQVEERVGRSVTELLDEIRTGHRAAIEAISGVEEEKLQRELPIGFRPGEAPVVDLMIMGGPRHDNGHVDQIEAALQP